MRLLLLSDIHGDMARLGALENQFKNADAVLFAGDFACFKKPETAQETLEALLKNHETIFAVTGNCDGPQFLFQLESHDVNVQGNLVFYEGLFFTGSGGALKFTGVTPNEREEADLAADLKMASAQAETTENSWDNLILIAHNPPKDTNLDRITGGVHVGSREIRNFIEKFQPLLCLSGHIHESAGVDTLGKTALINPGSLAEGHYGIVELKNGPQWEIEKIELAKLNS